MEYLLQNAKPRKRTSIYAKPGGTRLAGTHGRRGGTQETHPLDPARRDRADIFGQGGQGRRVDGQVRRQFPHRAAQRHERLRQDPVGLQPPDRKSIGKKVYIPFQLVTTENLDKFARKN